MKCHSQKQTLIYCPFYKTSPLKVQIYIKNFQNKAHIPDLDLIATNNKIQNFVLQDYRAPLVSNSLTFDLHTEQHKACL